MLCSCWRGTLRFLCCGGPGGVEQLLAQGPQHHVRPLRHKQDVASAAVSRNRLAVPAPPPPLQLRLACRVVSDQGGQDVRVPCSTRHGAAGSPVQLRPCKSTHRLLSLRQLCSQVHSHKHRNGAVRCITCLSGKPDPDSTLAARARGQQIEQAANTRCLKAVQWNLRTELLEHAPGDLAGA